MAVRALTAAQRRALVALGNLGMKSAMEALAQLLGEAPALGVSAVEMLPLGRAAGLLDHQDGIVAGVTFRLYGATTGRFVVLLPRAAALALVGALTGRPSRRVPAFTEEDQSLLKEVGNIIGAAYVSAMANRLRVSIVLSIPHLVFDLGEAVLAATLPREAGHDPEQVLLVTRFADPVRGISGMVLLIPGGDLPDPLMDLLLATR